MCIRRKLRKIRESLARIENKVDALLALHERVVGIANTIGSPTPRKGSSMSKVFLVKKSARKAMAGKPGKADPGSILIVDNEDCTLTISGVDAAGNAVDISAVATLAATSSVPSILSVDAPSGMVVTFHGLTPGSATITVTATWTDGSVGPFMIDVPGTVSAGGPTGISVVIGVPSIRP